MAQDRSKSGKNEYFLVLRANFDTLSSCRHIFMVQKTHYAVSNNCVPSVVNKSIAHLHSHQLLNLRLWNSVMILLNDRSPLEFYVFGHYCG